MLLVALKPHDHDGKTYKPGDTYNLNDYHAKQLIELGFCREAGPETKAVQPEPPIVEETSKRHYKRRDMRPAP